MILASHLALSVLLLFEDKPWYFQWDLWVSVFTLLLVGVTTWLVLETRSMRKGSDKTMAEMAAYAATSARAAETSADATRALAEMGQRAWISIKSVYLLVDLAEQNVLALRVTLLNSGNTPCLITHIGFHYYVLANFPESPGYHSNHGPMAVVSIPPRQGKRFHPDLPIAQERLRLVRPGEDTTLRLRDDPVQGRLRSGASHIMGFAISRRHE